MYIHASQDVGDGVNVGKRRLPVNQGFLGRLGMLAVGLRAETESARTIEITYIFVIWSVYPLLYPLGEHCGPA